MSHSVKPLSYDSLKNIFYSIRAYNYDIPQIIKFFNQYSIKDKSQSKVLDVGCGYGEKLKALQKAGYDVLGIDVNPALVEANKKNGLNCMTLEEFNQNSGNFDFILMSHIVEHFYPRELKEFMDFYLDRLKIGGYLIIATPILSPKFYDDFDHIKPYYPQGILMVFSERYDEQVQYTSRNKLKLKDIWFRRRHYRPQFFRSQYIRTPWTKVFQLLETFSKILCILSLGLIGKTDGWIGVFEKVKPRNQSTINNAI